MDILDPSDSEWQWLKDKQKEFVAEQERTAKPKLCPLNGNVKCTEDRCGWWHEPPSGVGGMCVMRVFAIRACIMDKGD